MEKYEEWFYWSGVVFNIVITLLIIIVIVSLIPTRIKTFVSNLLTLYKPLICKKSSIDRRLRHLNGGLKGSYVSKENIWVYKWWIWILNKRSKETP